MQRGKRDVRKNTLEFYELLDNDLICQQIMILLQDLRDDLDLFGEEKTFVFNLAQRIEERISRNDLPLDDLNEMLRFISSHDNLMAQYYEIRECYEWLLDFMTARTAAELLHSSYTTIRQIYGNIDEHMSDHDLVRLMLFRATRDQFLSMIDQVQIDQLVKIYLRSNLVVKKIKRSETLKSTRTIKCLLDYILYNITQKRSFLTQEQILQKPFDKNSLLDFIMQCESRIPPMEKIKDGSNSLMQCIKGWPSECAEINFRIQEGIIKSCNNLDDLLDILVQLNNNPSGLNFIESFPQLTSDQVMQLRGITINCVLLIFIIPIERTICEIVSIPSKQRGCETMENRIAIAFRKVPPDKVCEVLESISPLLDRIIEFENRKRFALEIPRNNLTANIILETNKIFKAILDRYIKIINKYLSPEDFDEDKLRDFMTQCNPVVLKIKSILELNLPDNIPDLNHRDVNFRIQVRRTEQYKINTEKLQAMLERITNCIDHPENKLQTIEIAQACSESQLQELKILITNAITHRQSEDSEPPRNSQEDSEPPRNSQEDSEPPRNSIAKYIFYVCVVIILSSLTVIGSLLIRGVNTQALAAIVELFWPYHTLAAGLFCGTGATALLVLIIYLVIKQVINQTANLKSTSYDNQLSNRTAQKLVISDISKSQDKLQELPL